jgi:hypothetical protein
MGHLLAGKATDDLCVGNSTHDGGLLFEQCPVSAALTRTFYEALAAHPELLEPGPLLEGVEVEGLDKATTLAYDALAAGGRARTLVIANHTGWEAPLRDIGYYWDGSKPAIRPAHRVIVTMPVPPQRRVEGCWLLRPEGWTPLPWKLARSWSWRQWSCAGNALVARASRPRWRVRCVPETFAPPPRRLTRVIPSADIMSLRLATVHENGLVGDKLFVLNSAFGYFQRSEESRSALSGSGARAGLEVMRKKKSEQDSCSARNDTLA